jgi:hypothetical protein
MDLVVRHSIFLRIPQMPIVCCGTGSTGAAR